MCIGYLSSVAGVHRQISDMRGTLACVASPVLLRPARPALLYCRVWTWRDLSGHATCSYIYYTPYDNESKREDETRLSLHRHRLARVEATARSL